MFTIAGRSFVGVSKAVNQDAFCALVAESSFGDAALICVCDGVGGLASGEVASSAVVRELARWFEGGFPAYAAASLRAGAVDLAGIQGVWSVILGDLNRRMGRYGRDLNVRMGTTFTGLLACGDSYVIGHVGDCRAYLMRGGFCSQLTRDQTWVQVEVDTGRMGPAAALAHPQGSVIRQAVGAQEELEVEFRFGHVEKGDALLVCCDGLYRRLGNEAVAKALRALPEHADEAALADLLDDLTASAVEAGESDNLTGACLFVSSGAAIDKVPGEPSQASVAARAPCPDDEPTVAGPWAEGACDRCGEDGETAETIAWM